MNQLLLSPTDSLMMRDARPMEGSLSGHTLLWPTPDLITHALRGALHRSGITCHRHEYHPRGRERTHQGAHNRTALYGSLLHAGPFPVYIGTGKPEWYLPCPLDIERGEAAPTSLPQIWPVSSSTSLPSPLCYSVTSLRAPSKENRAPAWISTSAWLKYAAASERSTNSGIPATPLTATEGVNYADIADTEHHYGISRNDSTSTVKKGSFYSCTTLRLKPGWAIGSWVSSAEKNETTRERIDVLQKLLRENSCIVVGGQQRTCTAQLAPVEELPLPPVPELSVDTDGKVRVKWVLITPAIWSRHGEHPGGWLPSWVHAESGAVLLQSGDRSRRPGERRIDWRARLQAEGSSIAARLVAAVVGKPSTVTGYATPGRIDGADGPKTTHSAAPAGSVYYFECDSAESAADLCRVLHCSVTPTLNRRSELLGEQGFGLGLCTAWHFAQ